MHSRRAILYVPGDDFHKIQKSTTLGLDCICLDLEDGVANTRKLEARTSIVKALSSDLDFGNSERLVRINAIGSGLEAEDLRWVLDAHPDVVVVPKVENADQVRWVSQEIQKAEKNYNWASESIHLILLIESAMGIINIEKIVNASSYVQALIFGSEDYANDIGAIRTLEAMEVFFARSAVVLHASSKGLQAIDMVNTDFQDLERLRKEALQGASLGFVGKQIIHPNQVKVVQEAFTPSEEAINKAKLLIKEFSKNQELGHGAIGIDGKMVDAPIIKSAERVLERARAVGKL